MSPQKSEANQDRPALMLALVAEDAGHLRAVQQIADAVLREQVEWLADAEDLGLFRRWHQFPSGKTYLGWTEIRELARERGSPRRYHGHFGGDSRKPDELAARKALDIVSYLTDADAVVLARDLDNEDARRIGLERARSWHGAPNNRSQTVLLATPRPEVEAWALCGFVPANDQERAILRDQRKRLGFEPTETPERLTSGRPDDKKDCKTCWITLGGNQHDRTDTCLGNLSRLREFGLGCHVAAFIQEIETRLIPLVTPAHRPGFGRILR